ncbi:MAG: hypothetical protein MUF48_20490 [Pirellulaceae bacterium]|jgi:hypothetical protein|nr:hypothetical protein [Pirellulaceae bacterium]
MMKIKIAVVSILLTGVWLWSAGEADGAPRGRRSPHTRLPRSVRADSLRLNTGAAIAPRSGWQPSRWAEPQYTGGFHARYFDELPGMFDRMPMRGTAW